MTKFAFSRSFDFVKKLLDFSKKYVLVRILDDSRTTFTVYTFWSPVEQLLLFTLFEAPLFCKISTIFVSSVFLH